MNLSDKGGTYFLYTDNGSLTSKLWAGDKWDDQDILAKGVRPGSPASYLLSPSTALILYITNSSALAALRYDDEEEEWVEDEDAPSKQLHSESKLAACFLPDSEDKIYTFFQEPSKSLVCLDSEWNTSILPANPLVGSPISATVIDDKVHVFYISDKDHYMHYLVEETGGSWIDNIMAKCVLDETFTRFMVAKNNESKVIEAYMLSVGRVMMQIVGEGDGELRELGKVDKDDKFVPGTSAECCMFIWVPIVFFVRRTRWNRCCCW